MNNSVERVLKQNLSDLNFSLFRKLVNFKRSIEDLKNTKRHALLELEECLEFIDFLGLEEIDFYNLDNTGEKVKMTKEEFKDLINVLSDVDI